jgi:hypothetical protein
MGADLYTYARLCNDVYTPGKTAGLQVLLEDRYRNFAAKIYRQGQALIVSYAGTDDAQDAVVEDAVGIGLSGSTLFLHAGRATDLTRQLKDNMAAHYSVEVCGHSLGGAYAQLVARELDLTCVTFNAPGVSHMAAVALPGGVFNSVNQSIGTVRNLYGGLVDRNTMYHFRHPQDAVSRVGQHCGTRGCRNLPMPSFPLSQVAQAHSIANIEQWLKNRAGRGPSQF